MPDPLLLLNGSPQRTTTGGTKPADERIVHGVVSKVEGTNIFALVPAYSSTYNYGPLELSDAQVAAPPDVGDKCLIAFDDQNTSYLLWFKS